MILEFIHGSTSMMPVEISVEIVVMNIMKYAEELSVHVQLFL